jgi:hypothetical protein
MCMHMKILMLDPLGRNFIFQASRTGGCCITKISGEPSIQEYSTQDKAGIVGNLLLDYVLILALCSLITF